MLDTNAKPKWVQRTKWTQIDGTEREHAYLRTDRFNVDELEALGHEVLRVAPVGGRKLRNAFQRYLPTRSYVSHHGDDVKIATWVEHPWALVRVGKGTSVVFLVKEQNTPGSYQAWIVAAEKDADCKLRWKCRFEGSTTVDQRDLIHVFRCALPYSPSLGDLELARLKSARAVRARAS